MKPALKILTVVFVSQTLMGQVFCSDGNQTTSQQIGNVDLQTTIDKTTGLPTDIMTREQHWLNAPITMTVKRETTGAATSPVDGSAVDETSVRALLTPLGLAVSSRWSQDHNWLVWDLEFTGEKPRTGHEVILDLPMLRPSLRIFTPGDRGVMDLAMHPTFKPVPYGVNQWNGSSGESYVLPLVSIFNPASDSALTIALPPDTNIPHMQVEWKDARTLRLTFGHRGMGGGKSSALRIMFATHAADLRPFQLLN